MSAARSRPGAVQDAVIALDLGGTKLAGALFGADDQPVDKRSVALDGRQGTAVAELIVREVRHLVDAAAGRQLCVRTVGVCVPGVVQPRTGRVWAPNIPDWDDYPLRDEITAAVADLKIQVVVDNDRAASVVGEAWQGAARGLSHAIFLAVGTGIGAGILVEGRVLDGAHGIAGAIGWLALNRPYRSEYDACGCFESQASGDGLAKVARALLAKNHAYHGALRAKTGITTRDVFDGAEHGDDLAQQVLQQAVQFWGMASANLVSLFNPEMIVFGGGVFGPATPWLGAVATEARRWAQPVAIDRVRFEPSQLGGDAALYGAAYLARYGRPAPPAELK